ncbi:hypothetical protein CROQUDRAFT_45156 [Cronartium quercuum f. sp. fusiforme G11]|uniref:Endonuclease/exonuclease/phosphatase domain-containing protein n=1 Tax=Cronartium quercuum f. sp. fusiforme G11 TaxID=708437 RepID=A0A9P6NH11_9BASI|nr:hypothetical protein CROQUDRAFT_45156 [Cronartium quercuum f. sp. fusiforme G11]
MQKHHNRKLPTSDSIAKKLVSLNSNLGFKLVSEKGIPTQYFKSTNPTTINLVWASWNLADKVIQCKTLQDSWGSDHHPVATTLNLSILPCQNFHISVELDN